MKSTWEEVKNLLKSELPNNHFTLWINPLTCLNHHATQLVLGCPNKFSRKWVSENYLPLIQKKFHEIGGAIPEIQLRVQPAGTCSTPGKTEDEPLQLPLPAIGLPTGPKPLNRLGDFTFDSFVVGPCNEFAYSASKAMSLNERWDYHSLLMLANTGLGKTHLAKAVGCQLLRGNPGLRVNYVTAEDFTNEMVVALKNNQIDQFKQKYRRSCDVLLLEEIHFLGGKEKTQAELGHTLDALANDKKKIIFTSAMPPKDIPSMSKELSSRLTSGLVTTIGRPDFETRTRILTRKADQHRLNLDREIINMLADALKRDIRQMESALKCIRARSELLNVKIDRQLVRDILSSLVTINRSLTSQDIEQMVCQYYKIDSEMLQSKSRKKVFAFPRNVYAYLCRKFTDETLECISKRINRSHSTVLYASELIEKKMKTDNAIRKQIGFISERLEELIKS
ncbi:Chromosomal replication initiator protein DnaA [uncultured Desulfatiglans sp.]|nr:Chromosomal replication initiator protein DnaA [uncultured Desulfatiglans sp.]